jgi:hypothetical protein
MRALWAWQATRGSSAVCGLQFQRLNLVVLDLEGRLLFALPSQQSITLALELLLFLLLPDRLDAAPLDPLLQTLVCLLKSLKVECKDGVVLLSLDHPLKAPADLVLKPLVGLLKRLGVMGQPVDLFLELLVGLLKELEVAHQSGLVLISLGAFASLLVDLLLELLTGLLKRLSVIAHKLSLVVLLGPDSLDMGFDQDLEFLVVFAQCLDGAQEVSRLLFQLSVVREALPSLRLKRVVLLPETLEAAQQIRIFVGPLLHLTAVSEELRLQRFVPLAETLDVAHQVGIVFDLLIHFA